MLRTHPQLDRMPIHPYRASGCPQHEIFGCDFDQLIDRQIAKVTSRYIHYCDSTLLIQIKFLLVKSAARLFARKRFSESSSVSYTSTTAYCTSLAVLDTSGSRQAPNTSELVTLHVTQILEIILSNSFHGFFLSPPSQPHISRFSMSHNGLLMLAENDNIPFLCFSCLLARS